MCCLDRWQRHGVRTTCLIKAVQRPVFAVWNAWIICGHPECPVNLSQAQTAQAAVALDRNELGALLVAAGLDRSSPRVTWSTRLTR